MSQMMNTVIQHSTTNFDYVYYIIKHLMNIVQLNMESPDI